METECIESQKQDLFYSMDLGWCKYNIYTNSERDDDIQLSGSIINQGMDGGNYDEKEVSVEEVVKHMIKFFGYQREIPDDSITYEARKDVNKNGKENITVIFYGPFGYLKIDNWGNLVYSTSEE